MSKHRTSSVILNNRQEYERLTLQRLLNESFVTFVTPHYIEGLTLQRLAVAALIIFTWVSNMEHIYFNHYRTDLNAFQG